MCADCREWMDGFADQFRPIVREVVDEVYTFLERRIAGYKRDGDAAPSWCPAWPRLGIAL